MAITTEELNRMYAAAPLLPEPGPEVVRQLIDHIRETSPELEELRKLRDAVADWIVANEKHWQHGTCSRVQLAKIEKRVIALGSKYVAR